MSSNSFTDPTGQEYEYSEHDGKYYPSAVIPEGEQAPWEYENDEVQTEAKPEGEKSWFRNSWFGRLLGLDDETAQKREQTRGEIASRGMSGGGGWFSNSWFGRLFGFDDETRLARSSESDATQLSKDMRDMGLRPGGYLANSWIGRMFGQDDASRYERAVDASRYLAQHSERFNPNTGRVQPYDNQHS